MKNISDEFVRAALGKIGEQPIPGNTRNRWGMVRHLNAANQRVATFIATDVFDLPQPLAVALSFSLDGQVFSPTVPGIGNNSVIVDLIRGIDPQSSPVTDRHELFEGERQDFCAVIAQSLQVVCRLDGEPPLASGLFVAVVVAPVTSLDCEQIAPNAPVPGPAGFNNMLRFQFDADGVARTLSANDMRRIFIVQNRATTGLEISFAGAPQPSIYLPGGINAIYSHSSPNPWYGELTFQHDAVDPTGFFTMGQSLAPFVAGFPDTP